MKGSGEARAEGSGDLGTIVVEEREGDAAEEKEEREVGAVKVDTDSAAEEVDSAGCWGTSCRNRPRRRQGV